MYISNLIFKLKEKFKSSLFFQNIAVVAGGNIAGKLIGILAAPVITRIYSPEDYGIFAVFASVVAVGGSLSTLRYAVTIPIAKDESLADNLLKLSFLITFILSVFFGIVILFFGNDLTQLFSVEQITPFLWILPLAFLGRGLYEALTNWNVRHKYYRIISRTRISQGISASGFKIGLGAIGIKPLGLLVGILVQEITGILSLLQKLIKEKPGFFRQFEWRNIKYAAWRFKRFPLFQSWSQLLLSLAVQLPVIMIASIYGAEVVGVFGLAQNMINMPMNLLGISVSQVYYGEISKYGKENPEKIYKLSLSVVKKMFFVAFLPIGLIVALGPWMFGFVFGAEWFDAGVYAQILSLIILTRFISSPIAKIFYVFEKQDMQLYLNIVRVVLILFVFGISYYLGLSAIFTIGLYSIIMAIYYVFLMIILFGVVKNRTSLKNV